MAEAPRDAWATPSYSVARWLAARRLHHRERMKLPMSDALVLFGATGDLAFKKVFPALQAMIKNDRLNVPVIGVAKSGFDLEQLKARVKLSLDTHGGGADSAAFDKLSSLLRYVDGDYQDPKTFDDVKRNLGAAVCPLHYLAIPQTLFTTVVEQLGRSGATDARVVVEKPFGRDLNSAQTLNRALLAVFPEANVFRIDHYLGKEPVQNLLYFRFSNPLFEAMWNRGYIECVQITMAESFGIEGRGSFYDQTGAVRDVIENHLLQVVACLIMDVPSNGHPESVRDQKARALASVSTIDARSVVRGQFRGYRNEPGVAPDSQMETYAAVRLHVDTPRWEGVPFYIRAGKCLPTTTTEVRVILKIPADSAFGERLSHPNYIRFELGPDVAIALGVCSKVPGETMVGRQVELVASQGSSDEMAAYERLIGDAMRGDPILFAREDAVEEEWRIVASILSAATPPVPYEPGTWGPAEADRLFEGVGGWREPGTNSGE